MYLLLLNYHYAYPCVYKTNFWMVVDIFIQILVALMHTDSFIIGFPLFCVSVYPFPLHPFQLTN